MKNIIQSILSKNNILFAMGVLFIGLAACDDPYQFHDYREDIEAEQELLDRYYNEKISDGITTRHDSMSAAAVITDDRRDQSGLMIYHTWIGDGDSIEHYDFVSYRYKTYAIGLETVDTLENGEIIDITVEVPISDNLYEYAPATVVVYPLNGSPTSNSATPGINEALLEMRLRGKAKIVVPSAINNINGYYTTIYELEVTAID